MMTRCIHGGCTTTANYDVRLTVINTGEFSEKDGRPIREPGPREITPGEAYCLRHARKMAKDDAAQVQAFDAIGDEAEREADDDARQDRDLRQQFGASAVLPGFEDGQQGRMAT